VDGVSRRHARITFDGKSYWIENLSPAGTFLNGNLVVRERLAHLDVITLGKNVDLLFLLRPEDQGTPTTEGIVRAALVPEGADAVPYEIVAGEILIGRSSANNVVVETSGAVSKVHARIERTPQQLILRDLGSSNGTYVNGESVMTALLRDGDVIALANVINYRVIIERGAVLSASVAGLLAPEVPTTEVDPRALFSPEWKTRYDWDSSEIKGIAALQARLIAEDGERKRARAKKEGATERLSAVVPPKPAAPRAAEPGLAAKGAAAAVPPAKDDASAAKAAADALAAASAAAGVDAPVAELRLTGPAGDLVVTQPGEYNLGRAKDSALRVDNPTVSRRHALIVMTEDRKAFLEDSGGANGTRLNGANVTKCTRLSDGDRVGIGEVELRVRLTRGSC
jgi:pSer/pThr/pTyr-binding forkhead associated (FHA) protein